MQQTKLVSHSELLNRLMRKLRNMYHNVSVSRIRGFDIYCNSPDRLVLEDVIIPYFIQHSYHKILFVGCDWYTKPYRKLFKNQEYWTIEIDAVKKKFGSKNHHITDSLLNLSKYIEPGYFDLIIYNGVFGYGINSREDTEESFEQCFQALRAGGILVFGWNDVPEYKPFPFTQCANLEKFEPFLFTPLSTCEYLTPNTPIKHTYNFYIKPDVK